MQTSPRVPAAEGALKVSKGENENQRLQLKVEHLAEPEKMAPGATTYVVWIQTPEGQVQNVGALQIDDKRSGRLETVTPHKDFQVFVTAEPSPAAAVPTSERLMYGNFRDK